MVPHAVSILLFFGCFTHIFGARTTAVTNEDIRDAILQVVNVVRSSEDKLERHEYRDRVLGEQLKKGMITIDKRIKLLDPLKGTVSRLDERLAAVETILMQKDERERIQLQKTYETVEDIQKNLPVIVEKLKNEIIEKLSRNKETPTVDPATLITKIDLQKLENDIMDKIDKVSKTINNMEAELGKIKDENKHVRDINNKSSENLEKVKRQLDSSEQLLEKYENKLAEYNNIIPQILPPANYKEEPEWEKKFLEALDAQKSQVNQIISDVQNVSNTLKVLPNKTEIQSAQNATLDSLNVIHNEVAQQPLKSTSLLDEKFSQVLTGLEKRNKDDQFQKDTMCEIALEIATNFSTNFGQMYHEIHALGKVEQVMVQTADGVLDTKRRLEYSVHQILDKVGHLIKTSTQDINDKMNERFDEFEMSILDEESGALANLTSKIGEEIDQVWRQIGIMHQQMSASTDTLNKLQNQTDAYVNGSLNVMDNMKGKVGQITGRMAEVDENLNYLLGRLSLVTQEFNQIKSGLGKALDEIRGSFKTVEDKIKKSGPGPHKITSSENDTSPE